MSALAICSRCEKEINLVNHKFRIVQVGHSTVVEHLICPDDLKPTEKKEEPR